MTESQCCSKNFRMNRTSNKKRTKDNGCCCWSRKPRLISNSESKKTCSLSKKPNH